jgi:hypothetical protein
MDAMSMTGDCVSFSGMPDKPLKSHLKEFWSVFDYKNHQHEANPGILGQNRPDEIGRGQMRRHVAAGRWIVFVSTYDVQSEDVGRWMPFR